jgi:hypothetical protein
MRLIQPVAGKLRNLATLIVGGQIISYRKQFRDLSVVEINSFIEDHAWTFAKTLPHIPHSYVVKAKCRSAHEFERFVMHIRKHGYKAKFGKTITLLRLAG